MLRIYQQHHKVQDEDHMVAENSSVPTARNLSRNPDVSRSTGQSIIPPNRRVHFEQGQNRPSLFAGSLETFEDEDNEGYTYNGGSINSYSSKKHTDLEMGSNALPNKELTELETESNASNPHAVLKDDGHGHGHGHGHHGPTLASLVGSAVVCFAIYFVFCIVFSAVVFDPLMSSSNHQFGVPQGVGINLVGIIVGSIFFAWRSGCPAIMPGPDLLPIVFLAEAGVAVVTYLADQSSSDSYADTYADMPYADNYTDPDAYRHRFLGYYEDSAKLDEEAMAKVIPTTLVAMMIGNAMTGLLFYGLGRLKTTASAIGIIPAPVIAGFLAFIGYKGIKLAVLISTGYEFKFKYIHYLGKDLPHANDPWLPLLISFVHGILLYTVKRMHIFPAERVILGFIAVPLVLFFVICTIVGADLNELREQGWFLSQDGDGQGCEYDCAFTRTQFWQPMQMAYGSLAGDDANIAWGVLPSLVPLFIMGSCMTALDSMLKLTASENALGVDLDYNNEMKLGGTATLASALLVGAPAYGQTKFDMMNLAVGRTTKSRIPTLGMGILALILLLSDTVGPIINTIPRFLLGGLCVYGSLGFLHENLWEGRKNMTKISFAIVWIIFLVNFIWEFFIVALLPKDTQPMVPGLLVIFVMGMLLSTFEFMFAFVHKAEPPLIRAGNECCSSAVRSEKHENQLAVMAPWFQVVIVDSFIFFGTANKLYHQVKEHLVLQKECKPPAERTKFLIFDLIEVTGIDPTAKNVFRKVHRLLKSEGVRLVWAMNHESKYFEKFQNWGIHDGTEQYDSLDLALRHVEDELLRHAHSMSYKWTHDRRVKALFEQQVLANAFSISVRPDDNVISWARLLPWSDKMQLEPGATLCEDGDDNLYLLYAGEVRLRANGAVPGSEESNFIFPGSFFNLDRVLVALNAMPGPSSTLGAVSTEDSVVLRISRKKFLAMQQIDGRLAHKLLLTLLVQKERFRPGRKREVKRRWMNSDHSVRELPKGTPAARLLRGSDYKVNLTESQVQRFAQVFNLIRAAGNGGEKIEMEHLARHVSMEAACLGSALSSDQFLAMIEESGIDEDRDGLLTLNEFLSFLRRLFLADLPSSEVPSLRSAYDVVASKAPRGSGMDEKRMKLLFRKLGFDTDTCGMQNVLGVIDSDGDGDVSFDEFLTGIAMLKLFHLQVLDLNRAFFENKRLLRNNINCDETDRDEELDAKDLESFLNVTKEEAEEMVFLADQDDVPAQDSPDGPTSSRTIDSHEFRELVLNWT